MMFVLSEAEGSLIRQWGIKVGYLSSDQAQLSNQFDTDLFYQRSGYSLGIFTEISIWKNFYFLGDLSYTQKGSKYQIFGTRRIPEEPGFEVIEYNFDNKLEYISSLLAVGYKIRLEFLNPYFLIGPRIDYLINGKHILNEPRPLEKRTDNLEKIIFGLSMGAGVEFSQWFPFNILLEFVYSPDFSNSYADGSTEIRNSSYEINIRIGF
jgi:hypothetical protein